MMIQTVTGPVAAEDLGLTLVHEHLRLRWSEADRQFPHMWDEAEQLARAVEDTTAARSAGVQTICDPAVMGIGRDVRFLQAVSEATGVNIVAATGIYTVDQLPPAFERMPLDDMASIFVEDIERGVQGTTVRAAFLKCATDLAGMTEGVERSLRAVARTHLRTGAPIMTHSHAPSRVGLDQQRVFADEGVDLRRVMIGHSGDTTDIEYLEALVAAGSFVGMDRFGLDDILPSDARLETIAELVARGHAGHVLLSQDFVCVNERVAPAHLRELRRDWGLTYVVDVVMPRLVAMGIAAEEVERMVTTNAWRWLSGSGPGD